MTKATLIFECKQLAVAVGSVGGSVPDSLGHLLAAHDLLSQPRATDDPGKRIVDAALSGELNERLLTKLLPAAAAAHTMSEYQQNLARTFEHTLVGAFHRELEKGGADQILSSMRPVFDRHAKAIAEAKSLFNSESTAEHAIASGDSGLVDAWNQLNGHLGVIGKIASIASQFGCRPQAIFPQVREFTAGDTYKISDLALMTTTGGLVGDSALFLQPDQGHRSSPFFRAGGLKLHSIAEAQARHDVWASTEFDRIHSGPPSGRLIDGQVVYDPAPKNPYRESANA